MKTLIIGACAPDRTYTLADPDAPYETEFEAASVKALSCLYSDYQCIVFNGSFRYEGRTSKPDLALVANDFSHWFVIEVELTSHSLMGHVIPQVTAFRYGDPQSDCASILERQLRIDKQRAKTLLAYVPRSVVVIANRRDAVWETALAAHNIQYGVISIFRTSEGTEALEFDGSLEVLEQNLGFGPYYAIHSSLRFPTTVKLPDGLVQIADPYGSLGTWLIRRDEKFAWITKEQGGPAIPDNASIQLRRAYNGTISMKLHQNVENSLAGRI